MPVDSENQEERIIMSHNRQIGKDEGEYWTLLNIRITSDLIYGRQGLIIVRGCVLPNVCD